MIETNNLVCKLKQKYLRTIKKDLKLSLNLKNFLHNAAKGFE